MRTMEDSFDTIPTSPEIRALEELSDSPNTPLLIAMSGKHLGEFHLITEEECLIGRSSRAHLRFDDEGVSRKHARIRQIDNAFFVEDLDSANGTFVNGEPVCYRQLEAGDKLTLGRSTVLKFMLCDPLDEAFHRRLLEAALRDGLTCVHNKRYLLKRVEDEFSFAQRHNSELSVLFVDLDNFKPINDVYGHLVGDDVLIGVAQLLSDTARREDVVGRYGGDEFVVICRNTGAEGAQLFAERLCEEIAKTRFKSGTHSFAITASIGIASLSDQESIPDALALVEAADHALYEAKDAGRNRVQAA